MFVSGKRNGESLTAVHDSALNSHRLFVLDSATKFRFLVDTGADLCVYQRKLTSSRHTETGYCLFAANGSQIQTFRCILLALNFGPRRNFTWRFVVADIEKPIIGADFLAHFGLLPDLKNSRLLDSTTELSVACVSCSIAAISPIKMLPNTSSWLSILAEFPSITKPDGICKPAKHATKHYITPTPGPPLASKARRLTPDRLAIAKQEFEKMVKLDIARRSTSPWSSPLLLVPKKSGDWRACGDFRQLNARTVPDRYLIRVLEDFTSNLAGKRYFQRLIWFVLLTRYRSPPMTSLKRR